MKLTLTHRNEAPSKCVLEMIAANIDHRHSKRSSRREAAPAIELTRRRPAGGQRK